MRRNHDVARRVHRAAAGTLLVAVAMAAGAQPQTVYVDDRVEIGLHEGPALDSTIVTLLPSGTLLEALERDGNLVRVQTRDGEKGWVDARFLTEKEPGRARLQAMENELAGAQGELAESQARVVALEQQLAEGAAQVATPGGDEAIPSEALREMQQLAEENQRLKQKVAELEAVQRMAREQAAREPPPAAAPAAPAPPVTPGHFVSPLEWAPWQLILLGSGLLLAFAAGGWLVDWSIRRRHGGFRV